MHTGRHDFFQKRRERERDYEVHFFPIFCESIQTPEVVVARILHVLFFLISRLCARTRVRILGGEEKERGKKKTAVSVSNLCFECELSKY